MFKSFIKTAPFGISLILILLAGVFLLLILPVFGNKTLIVRSGSMAPAIGVGDLIFVFPKQNYKVGDIIAFTEAGKNPTTITHRIATIKESPLQGDSLNTQSSQVLYQTKGDANKLPDETLVPKGNVLGTAAYSIKGLGKLFAAVKTKNGLMLTAVFPALLVIVLETINIVNALKKPKALIPSVVIASPAFLTKKAGRGNLLNGLPHKGLSLLRIILNFPKNSLSPMGLHQQSASIKSLLELLMDKVNLQGLKPNAGLPYYATSYKALLPYAVIVVLFVGTTFATTYSDSEVSAGNVFQAASVYPTPTPSGTPSPTPTPTPTPNPIAQTLVINEFLWDSSCGNNANQEAANYWIELFNGSGVTVDLKDWQFKDANNNIIQISNAVKLLDPGEYIVITKDGSVFTNCYTLQGTPETANLGGNADFLPATTGGVVKLEEPDGSGGFNVVDRVQYGPSQNSGVLNAPEDQSIARSPNGTDTALGDTFNTSDFAIDSSISPGVAN